MTITAPGLRLPAGNFTVPLSTANPEPGACPCCLAITLSLSAACASVCPSCSNSKQTSVKSISGFGALLFSRRQLPSKAQVNKRHVRQGEPRAICCHIMFLLLFTHLFIYLKEETQTVGLTQTEESLCNIHAQKPTKQDNMQKPSCQKVNPQLWCVSGTNIQLLGMTKRNPGFDGFYCSNSTKPSREY